MVTKVLFRLPIQENLVEKKTGSYFIKWDINKLIDIVDHEVWFPPADVWCRERNRTIVDTGYKRISGQE